MNLPLDQQGTVFHQQIPRIGKYTRKDDNLHCPVHVLDGYKGHQVPFFGVDDLAILNKSANSHNAPVCHILDGYSIGVGKLIQ